jgi:hypothetical protein
LCQHRRLVLIANRHWSGIFYTRRVEKMIVSPSECAKTVDTAA